VASIEENSAIAVLTNCKYIVSKKLSSSTLLVLFVIFV